MERGWGMASAEGFMHGSSGMRALAVKLWNLQASADQEAHHNQQEPIPQIQTGG